MSLTNVEEFVKVIHEDYSKKEKFVSIANTLLSNNKVIYTCQVPSHLHVEVTYSQTSNIYRYVLSGGWKIQKMVKISWHSVKKMRI